MDLRTLPTEELHPNPWNHNRMRGRTLDACRESIEHFGFVLPVLVRADDDGFEIVDGEHRWREAVRLGLEEIPAVVADLSDAEARKLTVVLAEATGDPDLEALATVLGDLREEPDFTTALPYTEAELDAILASSIGALEDEEAEEWRTFAAQIPRSIFAVYAQAEAEVAARLAEEDKALHPSAPVRRGQVLEILLAEYLAG